MDGTHKHTVDEGVARDGCSALLVAGVKQTSCLRTAGSRDCGAAGRSSWFLVRHTEHDPLLLATSGQGLWHRFILGMRLRNKNEFSPGRFKAVLLLLLLLLFIFSLNLDSFLASCRESEALCFR